MLGTLPILPFPAPSCDNKEDRSKEQPSSSSESADSTPVTGVATHTRMIGIVNHPPDVCTIIDKIAQFVAKNGLDFEKCIPTENTRKAKFSFLSRLDLYPAYCNHLPSRRFHRSSHQLISLWMVRKRWLSLMMLQPCSSYPSARSLIPWRLNSTQFCFQKGLLVKNWVSSSSQPSFVARNGKSFLTGQASRRGIREREGAREARKRM